MESVWQFVIIKINKYAILALFFSITGQICNIFALVHELNKEFHLKRISNQQEKKNQPQSRIIKILSKNG